MNYRFIGWCKEDSHDKVWGVIDLSPATNRCVTFWGRRGKKLQTNYVNNDYPLTKLIQSKENKGYVSIDVDKLNTVYPEFEQDLEKTTVWAILKI